MCRMRRTAFASLCVVVGFACTPSSAPSPPAVVACDSTVPAQGSEAFPATDVGVYVDSSDPILTPVSADVVRYLGEMWGAPPRGDNAAPDGSRRHSVGISRSPRGTGAIVKRI